MQNNRHKHNPWISHVKAYAASHRVTYGRALKLARPSYRSSSSAKRKALAKALIQHVPRVILLKCTAERDIRVLRVNSVTGPASPPFDTDEHKETMARRAPHDGIMMVYAVSPVIAFCEVILKSEVKKECSWESVAIGGEDLPLPLDIAPPQKNELIDNFIIPAGTVLFHAPKQRFTDGADRNQEKRRVEGAVDTHVVYFGLRPGESKARYSEQLGKHRDRLRATGLQMKKKQKMRVRK